MDCLRKGREIFRTKAWKRLPRNLIAKLFEISTGRRFISFPSIFSELLFSDCQLAEAFLRIKT
jgi:hypothetical protein